MFSMGMLISASMKFIKIISFLFIAVCIIDFIYVTNQEVSENQEGNYIQS